MTFLAIELLKSGTSCHRVCKIQQVPMPLRLVLTSLNYFKPDLPNGFWKLSEEIFNRISVKSEHVDYLPANCDVATRRRQLIYLVLIIVFCCSMFSVFFLFGFSLRKNSFLIFITG